jgi:hypothetical protein
LARLGLALDRPWGPPWGPCGGPSLSAGFPDGRGCSLSCAVCIIPCRGPACAEPVGPPRPQGPGRGVGYGGMPLCTAFPTLTPLTPLTPLLASKRAVLGGGDRGEGAHFRSEGGGEGEGEGPPSGGEGGGWSTVKSGGERGEGPARVPARARARRSQSDGKRGVRVHVFVRRVAGRLCSRSRCRVRIARRRAQGARAEVWGTCGAGRFRPPGVSRARVQGVRASQRACVRVVRM